MEHARVFITLRKGSVGQPETPSPPTCWSSMRVVQACRATCVRRFRIMDPEELKTNIEELKINIEELKTNIAVANMYPESSQSFYLFV